MTVSTVIVGGDILAEYLDKAGEIANQSMRLAINSTVKGKGMTLIKRKMLDEVAFPTGYLNGDRLKVTKLASNLNLEAVITGRKRATSLARFATGNPVPGSRLQGGVSVRVKKGRTTFLKKAFVVRLNKGKSLTEDNFNLGLAIRLQPGETISNKFTNHKSWLVPDQVALLYAPSVDQVFSSVIEGLTPEIGDMIDAEFHRQFYRLSNG